MIGVTHNGDDYWLNHYYVDDFPCSRCGKSFTDHGEMLEHERTCDGPYNQPHPR